MCLHKHKISFSSTEVPNKMENTNVFARPMTKVDILKVARVFSNQWENLNNKSTEKWQLKDRDRPGGNFVGYKVDQVLIKH